MTEGINITAATLKQWAEDESRLQREITDRQQELASVQKMRAAAAVLSTSITPLPGSLAVSRQISMLTNGHAPQVGQKNMSAVIEDIAKRSPAPISRKELRKQLGAAGFADEKLGAYFYTAVNRLKKRKRILMTADGKIWRVSA